MEPCCVRMPNIRIEIVNHSTQLDSAWVVTAQRLVHLKPTLRVLVSRVCQEDDDGIPERRATCKKKRRKKMYELSGVSGLQVGHAGLVRETRETGLLV